MIKKILILLFTLIILAAPILASAQQSFFPGELPSAANSGLRDDNLFDFISSGIRTVLGILGAILLVLIIYGGFLYATAAGNEERITQARNTLVYAIVGVVIISVAWILTDFIIGNILLPPV